MALSQPNRIRRLSARWRFVVALGVATTLHAAPSIRADIPVENTASLRPDTAIATPGACCGARAGLTDRPLTSEIAMLFDTSDFPPRWQCGQWSSALGWVHIVSDIAIFAAYITIPLILAFFIRKRSDLPFPRVFWLFVAFIVLCGLTHLMEAAIFYWPAYRIAGLLKIATAAISLLTSIALLRTVPKALQFKGPSELRRIVDEQTHALRQANNSLENANRRLVEAKENAESACRSKSKFLANISHEIRTPMTAILGFTELLADQRNIDPSARDAITTVERNGRHLLAVVNDILDLAKIESNELRIESIPTSPAELIRDVCMLHDCHAARKGVRLRHEISHRIPPGVTIDAARLRQILSNLIANAIASTDSGVILIRAEAKSIRGVDHLCIDVADSGRGLSKAEKSRVFEPFGPEDTPVMNQSGATGLGLTVSHRLAQLMGGSLRLVRSAIDEGSLFRLRLPFDRCMVPAHESGDGDAWSYAPDLGRARRKRPLAGVRALLADDGVDNQKLFSILLRNAGAKVTIVENGREAVRMAQAAATTDDSFDIILMDMQMPVMDGYDATLALRESGYDGAIIALTAHALSGDKERCLEVGCDDYMAKPARKDELIEVINKYALRETLTA
ncbi:MAG TPA: response regulator [Phycisphaerae bacterium]|nr:response regulator [Phycisphaerae bacterium]